MPGPPSMLSSSATPNQKTYTPQVPSNNIGAPRTSLDRNDGGNLQPPGGGANGAPLSRNLSASVISFGPRGSSLNTSSMAGPGSFSSDLRSQMGQSRTGSRMDVYTSGLEKLDENEDGGIQEHEQALAILREKLIREYKIKEGSENMLEALNSKKAKQTKEQRQRVEAELNSSNTRIKGLKQQLEEMSQRARLTPITPTRTQTTDNFFGSRGMRSPPSASRSGAGSDVEEPAESPTYALAEILQALEIAGLTPEYYVAKANSLVDLFKRYPILKYDLVWSVFGLRMQVMLLSESREVVAAGYRMTRYAMSDVSSLKKIRTLNTDYVVIS